MTTFRVGYLTFNLCVTSDLSALRLYRLCRVADRGDCFFVRHPAATLSEHNLQAFPQQNLHFYSKHARTCILRQLVLLLGQMSFVSYQASYNGPFIPFIFLCFSTKLISYLFVYLTNYTFGNFTYLGSSQIFFNLKNAKREN